MAANNNKIFGMNPTLLKMLIIPFGVTVFLLSSIGFLFMPLLNSAKSDSAKINDYNNKNSKLKEKIDYLSSVDPNILAMNAANFNEAIFAEKNSYFLVDVVRSVGNELGFTVTNFVLAPGEVKDDSSSGSGNKSKSSLGVKKILVRLSTVGPKNNFVTFIERLENTLPLLAIDTMQMKTEIDRIKIDLTVSAFYVPDNIQNKIEILELSDLKLTEDERALVDKLGDYKKPVSNTQINISTSSAKFEPYENPNPFGSE